jgi:hypothetical protein
MSCPLYVNERLPRCAAVEGAVVPSLHERERFCRTAETRCPTYALYGIRRRPISEDAYLALWLPPLPASEPLPIVQLETSTACTI